MRLAGRKSQRSRRTNQSKRLLAPLYGRSQPTFGLIDRTGVRPFADSLDTVGVFARTVQDAAFFASVIAGRPNLHIADEVFHPRTGLTRTYAWEAAATRPRLRLSTRLRRGCVQLGWRSARLRFLNGWSGLLEAQKTIMAFEVARSHAPEMLTASVHLSAKLRELLEAGALIAPEHYDAARTAGGRGARRLRAMCWTGLMCCSLRARPERRRRDWGQPAIQSSTGFGRPWECLASPCWG